MFNKTAELVLPADFDNPELFKEDSMIKIGMLPQPLRREGLSGKLENICIAYDVVKLAIFGSFVKDLHNRKSDVDIAVEFDNRKPKDLFDLVRLERELRGIFRRKVDLGIISSINPHVYREVRKEMRIVYEKR
ncbi:MAG: nucleotidyltransferase domain-containing protein [bacterium]|nr:nucleotidyltransferase domain-containing protein [bacterium]